MSERRSTWARFLFLFNYGSLVAFGKVVKTAAKTVGNSQTRPSALLNYETSNRARGSSYRTRTGARDREGYRQFTLLIAKVGTARCRSAPAPRVVVDPEMSCAPRARITASCRTRLHVGRIIHLQHRSLIASLML